MGETKIEMVGRPRGATGNLVATGVLHKANKPVIWNEYEEDGVHYMRYDTLDRTWFRWVLMGRALR